MTSRGALRLSDKDNVATSLEDIESGAVVLVRLGKGSEEITALEEIPFGFKIAVMDILQDDPVIKYGEPIGTASQKIKKGQLVHIHNIAGARGRGDLTKGG
jgi:altronate dehydratase small subunit